MKKVIKAIFLFSVLLLVSCSEDTIGEIFTGSVSGIVKDKETEEPLENVKITTSPASSTVFTDENGEFILENIEVDDYSVKAEADGYVTSFEAVSVIEDNRSSVAFELEKSTSNNRLPSTPQLLTPEDDAKDVDLEVEFIWNSSDPDGDELTYELELKNNRDDEVLLFSDIKDTTYVVKDLKYDHKYFWQVKVSDSVNTTVFSKVNTFTTLDAPANNNYLFVREIDGNNVIFSADSEGNELQLTSSANNSFRPRKNLDVDRIAFYRTTGGETHLFTMDLDGTNKMQVTNSVPANGINTEKLGYSWADDGKYLYYPNFDKVYKINADGSGKGIIYQAPSGRYVMDIQQSEDRSFILVLETNLQGFEGAIFTITNEGERINTIIEDAKGTLDGIDVSVNNNLILYTRDVSDYESPSGRQLNAKMFIYKVDTGVTYDLSDEKLNGTNDTDPRFAPNEASLIFVNSSNEAGSQKSLYQVLYDENLDTFEIDRELLIENAKMPDWE